LASVWAYAGLRRTEALRLRVEDVDLDRRLLWVRGNGRRLKTRASAAPVPICSALAGTLDP
jgi:integrase